MRTDHVNQPERRRTTSTHYVDEVTVVVLLFENVLITSPAILTRFFGQFELESPFDRLAVFAGNVLRFGREVTSKRPFGSLAIDRRHQILTDPRVVGEPGVREEFAIRNIQHKSRKNRVRFQVPDPVVNFILAGIFDDSLPRSEHDLDWLQSRHHVFKLRRRGGRGTGLLRSLRIGSRCGRRASQLNRSIRPGRLNGVFGFDVNFSGS